MSLNAQKLLIWLIWFWGFYVLFLFGSNDSSEAAIEFPSLITRSLIPNMSLLAQNWPIWVILGGLGF